MVETVQLLAFFDADSIGKTDSYNCSLVSAMAIAKRFEFEVVINSKNGSLIANKMFPIPAGVMTTMEMLKDFGSG